MLGRGAALHFLSETEVSAVQFDQSIFERFILIEDVLVAILQITPTIVLILVVTAIQITLI